MVTLTDLLGRLKEAQTRYGDIEVVSTLRTKEQEVVFSIDPDLVVAEEDGRFIFVIASAMPGDNFIGESF